MVSLHIQDLSLFKFQLDTLNIAKYSVRQNKLNRPDNYWLSTIYSYLTSKELENAHSADADVQATVDILRHEQFWKDRKTMLKTIDVTTIRQQSVSNNTSDCNDSDTDQEEDLEESDNEEETITNLSATLSSTQWTLNTPFNGLDSESIFETKFARPDTCSISGGSKIGLQEAAILLIHQLNHGNIFLLIGLSIKL